MKNVASSAHYAKCRRFTELRTEGDHCIAQKQRPPAHTEALMERFRLQSPCYRDTVQTSCDSQRLRKPCPKISSSTSLKTWTNL